MKREDALLKVAHLYDKAEKLEKSVNWNNDAERDSALNKIGHLIIDANYLFAQYYKKGV